MATLRESGDIARARAKYRESIYCTQMIARRTPLCPQTPQLNLWQLLHFASTHGLKTSNTFLQITVFREIAEAEQKINKLRETSDSSRPFQFGLGVDYFPRGIEYKPAADRRDLNTLMLVEAPCLAFQLLIINPVEMALKRRPRARGMCTGAFSAISN